MQAIMESGYSNLAAKNDGIWTAWTKPEANNGWHSLLLWKKKPGPKGSPYKPREKYAYHLGWNGQRFAKSSELEILRAREPQVYSWLKTEVLPQLGKDKRLTAADQDADAQMTTPA